MDLKKIGQNIRCARDKMGFTQAELAEKSGFSDNHISRLETGTGTMSLESLIAISNVLNTTPDYLLMGEYNITAERASLVMAENFKDLTSDELTYIIKSADLFREVKVNRK